MLEIVENPILFATLACLCVYLYIFHNSRLSSPPGPKPLPLLGNILSIPSRRPWETYAAWAREYKSEHAHPSDLDVADTVSHPCLCIADIVSVYTFGHLTLVVNTIEAAKDMFERRSAVYSDRPHMTMIDMCVHDLSAYICNWTLF